MTPKDKQTPRPYATNHATAVAQLIHAVKAGLLTAALTTASSVAHGQSLPLQAPCVDAQWSKARLIDLAHSDFALPDSERDEVAIRLSACLAQSEPELRDTLAFSGLSQWLRASALKEETVRSLYDQLSADIGNRKNDPNGVYLPFAILTMAELARVDRITPYLEPGERVALSKLAADTMASIRDYRGFDDSLGWRHQVAHSADLLLQLVLNPAVSSTAVMQLIESLQSQISPAGHFYVYGEPERLARPILYAMLRDDISDTFWQTQLAHWSTAAHIDSWDQAFASHQGLAERHNRKAFFAALLLGVYGSKQPRLQAMQPAIEAAMKKLP